MNTDRMSCGEALEKLPLFVGGDLDADMLDAVRAHLVQCERCAWQAGEAARARRALIGAFRVQDAGPADSLWPGIRAALRAEGLVREGGQALPRSVRAPARRWLRVLAPLAAAAALVALLDLSGLLQRESKDTLRPLDGGAGAIADGGSRTVELLPVEASRGTLERVAPGEIQLGPAYRRPGAMPVAGEGDASLANFR